MRISTASLFLAQPVPTHHQLQFHAFPPPERNNYRTPDTTDTFSAYKYRRECGISSLSLHAPFSPLCSSRETLLEAMSTGGRIGFDAPYMPRSCDMRWFTTTEICEILGRFDKVVFLGDSMIRHIVGAINVLVREDLGYGAVTNWNFSDEEKKDCFCLTQFNGRIRSLPVLSRHVRYKAFIKLQMLKNTTLDLWLVKYPIPRVELDRLSSALGTKKTEKPLAFVYGMGLWNNLDIQATISFLMTLENHITSQLPHLRTTLSNPNPFFPRLFVTPSAAGKDKPEEWEQSQGNKALMLYEDSVKEIARKRNGMEVLGTWNATIQASKYDGVHVDLRANLLKAMCVFRIQNMLIEDETTDCGEL
ncbi:hypothetical protein DFH27DRAFT_652796 [Peziza echinospora]|nr:hypothetical protein DFH27DRAFT_652796 [Peziza echinospora]